MKIPTDVHLYDIWANGGEDPWDSSELISMNGSILCFGPHGCGKTFLANRLVSLTGRSSAELNAADILKNPTTLAEQLDNALSNEDCILILENVDSALTGLQDASAHQLLIDRLRHPPSRAAVFATAAYPSRLSEEELGAFKYVLPVFYGDAGLREVQIVTHAEDIVLMPDADLRQVAKDTEWWSGEELATLMKAASDDRPDGVTQADLSREMNLIGTNIVPENRKKRMSELLQFTAENGTSQYVRTEIKSRFGPNYLISSDTVPSIGLIGQAVPGAETTLADQWLKRLKSWWPAAILIVIGAVIIALGNVATAITAIKDFFKLARTLVS